MKLHFYSEDGCTFLINERTLLIFLDETGEETFSDKAAPIFGIGGLLVEAAKYFSEVENPWHSIKEKYTDGVNYPFHATDLPKPVPTALIASLNKFFTNDFGRVAVTSVDKTIVEANIDIERIIFAQLWTEIKKVANKMQWTDIHVFFEENLRLLPTIKQEFMSKKLFNSKGVPIITKYNTLLKDPYFAGMEVADFIIHTAGWEARGMRDKLFQQTIPGSESNLDFQAVFRTQAPTAFLNISRVRK